MYLLWRQDSGSLFFVHRSIEYRSKEPCSVEQELILHLANLAAATPQDSTYGLRPRIVPIEKTEDSNPDILGKGFGGFELPKSSCPIPYIPDCQRPTGAVLHSSTGDEGRTMPKKQGWIK